MDRVVRRILLGLLVLGGGVLLVYRDVFFSGEPAYARHIGEALPNPTLNDLDGGDIKLVDLLARAPSEKWVINLWATWCDPCVRELPLIHGAEPLLKENGIKVLLINYDGPVPDKVIPEAKAWLIANRIEMKTYFEFGEQILKTFDISALPFTMGVSGGKIDWLEMGELNWEKPQAIVRMFH